MWAQIMITSFNLYNKEVFYLLEKSALLQLIQ